MNHLQLWNKILVASAEPVASDKADDNDKEKDTAQGSDSNKITFSLYSDQAPYVKSESITVEKKHFEFVSVANDRREQK